MYLGKEEGNTGTSYIRVLMSRKEPIGCRKPISCKQLVRRREAIGCKEVVGVRTRYY